MKLVIKRDQDKGLLGGIRFVLHLKVQLTPQEEELIKKYKAHKEILATKGEYGAITIGNLVDGISQKCKDVTTLIGNEEIIKEACGTFKTYLGVMASFGGQEVIEY